MLELGRLLLSILLTKRSKRAMEDWVILAPTRWKLRQAIQAMNRAMADLRTEKHPDKTVIGWISHCSDFLGDWFSPLGLGIAHQTVERFLEKVSWLYKQGGRLGALGNMWGSGCGVG